MLETLDKTIIEKMKMEKYEKIQHYIFKEVGALALVMDVRWLVQQVIPSHLQLHEFNGMKRKRKELAFTRA